MEKTKVDSKLKAKNDGRKKAWWVKKIEKLEEELESFKNGSVTTPSSSSSTPDSKSYADGFVDCMHKFQILNKSGRKRLYEQMLAHGPGAVKRLKKAKFRGLSL